jgi:hypothetical protein
MFFEQPLLDGFKNVNEKWFLKGSFWKGAPVGRLPPRRGGRERSEHIDKSLTANRVDICNIGLFHAFFEIVMKGRNENVTNPKSVLK